MSNEFVRDTLPAVQRVRPVRSDSAELTGNGAAFQLAVMQVPLPNRKLDVTKVETEDGLPEDPDLDPAEGVDLETASDTVATITNQSPPATDVGQITSQKGGLAPAWFDMPVQFADKENTKSSLVNKSPILDENMVSETPGAVSTLATTSAGASTSVTGIKPEVGTKTPFPLDALPVKAEPVSSVLAPEIPPFSGIAVRSVSNPKNGSVQVGRLKEISSLTAMPNEEATAETTQWHGTPRTRATTIREDVETVTDGVPQNQRQTDIKSNGAHLVAELQFQAREAPSQVLAGLDPLAGWPATQQDGALKPTGGMSHANPHGSAETARSIATQILPIVTQGKPGTSEIALNPQELGRVRIHLTPVDQTMTISILSERPETADLMRRHGDMLVQEFRSIGYSDVRLDFGQMGQRQPGQDQLAEQTPSGSRARQQGDQDIAQGVADIPTGLRRAHPRGEGSLDLRL